MGDHRSADASGFEICTAEEPVDDGADDSESPVWCVAETEVDGAGDGADDEQRGGSIVHGFAQRPEEETAEEEFLAERDYGEDADVDADGVERKQPPRGVWRAGLEDAQRVGDEEAGRHGLEEVLRSDAPLGFCGNEAEAYAFGFAEQQDRPDGEADPHEVAEDVETEAGDGVGVDFPEEAAFEEYDGRKEEEEGQVGPLVDGKEEVPEGDGDGDGKEQCGRGVARVEQPGSDGGGEEREGDLGWAELAYMVADPGDGEREIEGEFEEYGGEKGGDDFGCDPALAGVEESRRGGEGEKENDADEFGQWFQRTLSQSVDGLETELQDGMHLDGAADVPPRRVPRRWQCELFWDGFNRSSDAESGCEGGGAVDVGEAEVAALEGVG